MIDVQSVICQRLIDNNIADGNVIIPDKVVENFDMPVVFVSESVVTGNVWTEFWESTITVSCSAVSDSAAAELAYDVRNALDGWGEGDVLDVTHVSTYPQRTEQTNPTIFTRNLTFSVKYQE